jgi:hypothetical protein
MCHLPVHHCTDPSGAAYSNMQVISSKEPGVGSRAYIPTCLPVARDEEWRLTAIYALCCVLVRLNTFIAGFTL